MEPVTLDNIPSEYLIDETTGGDSNAVNEPVTDIDYDNYDNLAEDGIQGNDMPLSDNAVQGDAMPLSDETDYGIAETGTLVTNDPATTSDNSTQMLMLLMGVCCFVFLITVTAAIIIKKKNKKGPKAAVLIKEEKEKAEQQRLEKEQRAQERLEKNKTKRASGIPEESDTNSTLPQIDDILLSLDQAENPIKENVAENDVCFEELNDVFLREDTETKIAEFMQKQDELNEHPTDLPVNEKQPLEETTVSISLVDDMSPIAPKENTGVKIMCSNVKEQLEAKLKGAESTENGNEDCMDDSMEVYENDYVECVLQDSNEEEVNSPKAVLEKLMPAGELRRILADNKGTLISADSLTVQGTPQAFPAHVMKDSFLNILFNMSFCVDYKLEADVELLGIKNPDMSIHLLENLNISGRYEGFTVSLKMPCDAVIEDIQGVICYDLNAIASGSVGICFKMALLSCES